MCSLGHHDHPDDLMPVAPPRRHLDDTARQAVRAMPRKTLNGARARIHAALRAELDAEKADALAQAHGQGEQFELLDAVAQHRPVVARPLGRPLPPAETLWYSAAREA